MRAAGLDSLISKNSKTIWKSVQSRSDPSGGGGFNRAARSPQGPGTKSTMDESNSESKTTTNGKETSDIDI